jgi:3-dehydroquinate synthetase
LERTKADKKRVNGRSRVVLGKRVGEVEIVEGVEDETVRSGIEYVQQRY